MGAQPITLVIVGPLDVVHEWARQHHLHDYRAADRPQQLHGLPAHGLHIAMHPEWRRLREFHLLQHEVRFLERNGAYVEEL